MILSAPELDGFPASPNAGDVVFNTSLDGAYVWAPGASGTIDGGWLFLTSGAILRDSERIEDTLTRAAYLGKDYQTFIDEITANVKARYGSIYNDFITSAPGQMIIRYFAAALDTLSFNLDSRSTENYLFLAQLAASVAQGARALGYKPRRAASASVTLDSITLTAGPYAFDVPIPIGFQWAGPGGLIFEMQSTVVVPAGQTSVSSVDLFQGQTVNENFVSDGTANQRYQFRKIPSGQFIDDGTVEVTVNGSPWEEFAFLPFESENAFEVSYDTNPPYVRFGDGVLGNIPPQGADVAITYVTTQATLGNSIPSGSITAPVSGLTVNFQNIPLKATQTQTSSGGAPPEDPRSVQANAPQVFSTGARAVSQPDWDTLLNAFSDPVAGQVARGRAEIIRTVQNELTIQNLLTAIDNAANPSGALSTVTASNASIRSLVSAISTVLADMATQREAITSAQGAAETAVTDLLADMDASKAAIATVRAQAGNTVYQELLGQTDGSTTTFTHSVTRLPIVPGTVSVFVNPLTVQATNSVGDVTTTPGSVATGSPIFAASMIGQMIQIGAEFRRITSFFSVSQVSYSGPAIVSSTTLNVIVYSKAIVGFDDGAGSISGTGIASGSVNYATGAVSLTFATAPAGTPQFGNPITISYRYADTYLQGLCDNATSDIATAETSAGVVTAQLDSMDAPLTALRIDEASVASDGAAIVAQTSASDAAVVEALSVQAAVISATTALEDYLDQVISGPCKANIVQLKVLVYDANNNYVAPSQALLNAVGSYFQGVKVITTTASPVSGLFDVVAVNVTIKLQIAKGYLYSNVQPLVDQAVSGTPPTASNPTGTPGLLRQRLYGVHLLLSDIYKVIVPNAQGVGGVTGVVSAVVEITGSTFVDSSNTGVPPSPTADGDMVIAPGQVLARGNITYSQIIYPSSGS